MVKKCIICKKWNLSSNECQYILDYDAPETDLPVTVLGTLDSSGADEINDCQKFESQYNQN